MAYKTEIELMEEYINNIQYEIIKRDITLKDLIKQKIVAKDASEINKAEMQINNELTFLNRMKLVAIEEYNKKNTKIEK